MKSFLAALGAGALLAFAGAPAFAARAQSPEHANVYVPPAAAQAPSAGRTYANEVSALSDEQLAAAYGTAIPQWIPTPAPTTPASHDDPNGWRIAAILAGGLIAAIALGAAAVLRPRALRTGT